MKLEIAKPEDSAALNEFYKSFPVKGLVELKIDRNRDFFAHYGIQSDKHISYILRNTSADPGELNKIEGVASFIIRDVLLNNEIVPVAFGRDLRISNNRRAILEWTKYCMPVINEVMKTFGCKHLFSVLNMGESEMQAQNTFIRPRTTKRPLPHYYLYRRLNLVSLHGRFPWAKNSLPNLKIRHGNSGNIEALADYIVKKSKDRDLATTWDAESFYDNLARWKGLKFADFLVAFDRNDNVVGCAAPWSSGGIEDFIPMHYSLPAHNFRQFLKVGNALGWTRKLTKPYSRIKIESSLNFKYLNFLNTDNADIFESLAWRAYDNAAENEFLVYNQLRSEYTHRPPYNWVYAKQPFAVYLLQAPEQETPSFLHPGNERSIEMEPFFTV